MMKFIFHANMISYELIIRAKLQKALKYMHIYT